MKDNANFIEFALFFVVIAFVGIMLNLDNNTEVIINSNDRQSNLFQTHLDWEKRMDRVVKLGIVEHDSNPETQIFDIVLSADFTDEDSLSYHWEHVSSWDLNKNDLTLDTPISFNPDSYSSIAECKVIAGIHDFKITVTDTYGTETSRVLSIKVDAEENSAPKGSIDAAKRIPGCMDTNALNFNPSANSNDDSCNFSNDPFDGDVEKIKKFQTDNGLEADGQWGPTSQSKYEKLNPIKE